MRLAKPHADVGFMTDDWERTERSRLGFPEAWAPITLGATARVSFLCEPDGGFVEISQRASLTGPLPER